MWAGDEIAQVVGSGIVLGADRVLSILVGAPSLYFWPRRAWAISRVPGPARPPGPGSTSTCSAVTGSAQWEQVHPRLEDLTAVMVAELDRRTVGRDDPAVAPRGERHEHRHQIAARLRGQCVLVPGRVSAVSATLDDPVLYQRVESRRQEVAGALEIGPASASKREIPM